MKGGVNIEEKVMTYRYKKVLTCSRGRRDGAKIAKNMLTYFMDGP